MTKTLDVSLGERSYPIVIGPGLLGDSAVFEPFTDARQIAVVTNETVAPIYLNTLLSALGDRAATPIVLADGEQHKNLLTLNSIFSELLSKKFNRKGVLIALGGGVVGDLTGFAAACYQRGIDFIQAPTTLLAQVDSSVGGKTGVNHELGKNMIGAFYQPKLVVVSTDTLNTLDDRQLSSGIAEVIKYGLIWDREFFCWLEEHIHALRNRDPDALSYAIEKSCTIKAHVVAADERESGIRAILNLGHTFGHAIEAAMGYGSWLHGEAVGAGMCLAASLSHQLGWISADQLESAVALVQAGGLPIKPPADMTTEQFLRYMSVDKKNIEGKIRLVLLRGIGDSLVTDEVAESTLREFLSECLNDHQ